MTTAYLAARFSRKEEMQQVARDLAEYGIETNATWITGEHDYTGVPDEQIPIAEQAKFAQEDIREISDADVFILFTDEPGQGGSRGGKHVELGYVLGDNGWRQDKFVVGPVENIFVAWAISVGGAMHFPTYRDFLQGLIVASRAVKEYGRVPDPLVRLVKDQ